MLENFDLNSKVIVDLKNNTIYDQETINLPMEAEEYLKKSLSEI